MTSSDKLFTDFPEKTTFVDNDVSIIADSEDAYKVKKIKKSTMKGDTGASIIDASFSGDDILFTKDDATVVTLTDAVTELTGPQGLAGADGAVIYSTLLIPDNSLGKNGDRAFSTYSTAEVFYKSGGTWALVNALQGDTGETGASITSGAFVGNNLVFTKDDASTVTIVDAKLDLKGDTGDKGDKTIIWSTILIPDNIIGTDGDWAFSTSSTGNVFYKSSGTRALVNSYRGPAGETGATGPTGPAGADGTDGADGKGITSINKTGTVGLIDTYTITFSDSSTTTFDVTNGADGTDGTDGAGVVIGGTTGQVLAKKTNTNYDTERVDASTGNAMTITDVKIANYTANANEYIPCNISGGSFAITLPTAPAEGTRVQVVIAIQGTGMVEVKCGGSDVLTKAGGSTSTYMNLYIENYTFQYKSGIWYVTPTASPSNFATNNPGIDASTPITDTDISIDIATKVLTITPPLGYFYTYTDGLGKVTKIRHTGAVAFPAWTDTSGMWYFFFDNTGTATTTQTPWSDFNVTVPVYRILWNKNLFKFTVTAATATLGDTYTNNSSTFTVKETITGGTTLICERTTGTNDPEASGNLARATGAGTNPIIFSAWAEDVKAVAQYIEYHINDIPAATHLALHLDGARRAQGLAVASNAIATGTPNPDGRNTVIAISSGTVLDDNLPYTVTNDSTPTANRQQDLGDITPASLNATNSALFKVYTQNAAGDVSFLPATRFPFAWNATSNRPELISATGVRTVVNDNRWFVYFVYATQNPVVSESIKTISAPSEFTSLTNAQAYTWSSIQSLYPSIFGNDFEIRPLYRIIFYNDNSGGGAYNPGCKYSVIREIQDIRKGSVTSTTAATGSIPASSVTVVPAGNIVATNAQTALEELDTEKVATTTTITINGTTYDLSADRTWTVTSSPDTTTRRLLVQNM